MRTTIADRCTSLIGRARAALGRPLARPLGSPLRSHPFIRRPLGRRMRMELLDLELFGNDLHG